MTKGDKIKLRAELAGKAVAAILSSRPDYDPETVKAIVKVSVFVVDELIRELGISLDN